MNRMFPLMVSFTQGWPPTEGTRAPPPKATLPPTIPNQTGSIFQTQFNKGTLPRVLHGVGLASLQLVGWVHVLLTALTCLPDRRTNGKLSYEGQRMLVCFTCCL